MADEEKEFSDEETEPAPKNSPENSQLRLVNLAFDPQTLQQKLEMSDIPKGKMALRLALLLTQTRILKAMKDGDKNVCYGELLLDSLATVWRGSERRLIGEAIQMKSMENDKDSAPIMDMGSR